MIPRHLYTSGPSRSLTPAALEALLEYQRQKPWLYQEELVHFLKEEWNIHVHQSTVSRALKEARITRRKAQRIDDNQSEDLRIRMTGICELDEGRAADLYR